MGKAKKTKTKAPKAAPKRTLPSKKLPAALAERAEQEASAKKERLASTAKADIALIRRRQAQIAESFYDIGEALVRLKRPDVVKAAGHATFRELCEEDLEMSVATADRLRPMAPPALRACATSARRGRRMTCTASASSPEG